MKYLLVILLFAGYSTAHSQTLLWSDDFDGTAADWDLVIQPGPNDANANIWKINDKEGGVVPPGCGASENGDSTLYVSCQSAACLDTGAIYYPGDDGMAGFPGATDIRAAYTVPISTAGETNLEFVFDWIGVGQAGEDFTEIEYSIDGGTTWNVIWTQTLGTTCSPGQGEWSEDTISLPPATENQADLRFAFHWINNNDAIGSNPSFAVNNLRLFAYDDIANVPIADFVVDTNKICKGDCISFTDLSTNNPTNWAWTFEEGSPATSSLQNPTKICYDSTGIFNVTLTVSNENGFDQVTKNITVQDAPEVIGIGDTIIDIGGAAELNASYFALGDFFWEPAENIDCDTCLTVTATPYLTTRYFPTLIGSNGCIGRDTVLVVVNFEEIVEVPTAFSPNGDGLNDKIYVKGIGILNIDFKIFNRYGQMVYSSTDLDEGWDGTLNGQSLNQGVFVYTLEFDLINGQTGERSGNITLVK